MLRQVAETKQTLGDCTCLYKFEKDTISESIQTNLKAINQLIIEEESKRKKDISFIRYLKDKYTSTENLKNKVDRSVICGY